ncbi:MAG: hypothetical protein KF690_10960 [Bacteroidetes bacterium]|nr:hypothetical protein [Bacteroidota bacterium]
MMRLILALLTTIAAGGLIPCRAQVPCTPDSLDPASVSAELARKHLKQDCVQLLMFKQKGYIAQYTHCMEEAAQQLGYRYLWLNPSQDTGLHQQVKAYNTEVQAHLRQQLGADWGTRFNQLLHACNNRP